MFGFSIARVFHKRKASTRRRRRAAPLTPDAGLVTLWRQIRAEYFPLMPHLDEYTVTWSRRRQRRTLASCEIKRKVVRVAKEMRDPLFTHFLPPLLYHEMCHAALGEEVGYHRGKRAWHGPRFKALERLHPQIPALDAWIKDGGWHYAVRRARGIAQHQQRKKAA